MSTSRYFNLFLTHFFHHLTPSSYVITDMRSMHTSKSTPKPITTNLKLRASKETPATRLMI